jgi:hypothetical protein
MLGPHENVTSEAARELRQSVRCAINRREVKNAEAGRVEIEVGWVE